MRDTLKPITPPPKSRPVFAAGQYVLFGVLGLGLLWLAFQGQDLAAIWAAMAEADFRWLIPIILVSVLSNIVRAIRWNMLIHPLGMFPTTIKSFWALMLGYLVSYAIPRFGEVSRAAVLSKSPGIRFQPVFGTVVIERVVDLLCLGLLLLIALLIEWETVHQVYLEWVVPILAKPEMPLYSWLIGLFLVIFTLLFGLWLLWRWRGFLRRFRLVQKSERFIREIWQGIAAIRLLKQPILFLAFSAFIWLSYFLTTYLWFFAFEATLGLGGGAGLFLMIAGTLGKMLPIQGGGMGAYHLLVGKGLLLYGIGELHSTALAVLIHGTQTVYHLTFGSVAFLYFAWRRGR